MNKPLIVILGIFLLCAALASVLLQPKSPAERPDPDAERALELVRSHPARQAPTIQQAIQQLVRDMEQNGTSMNVGEWRVAKEPAGTYVVSILLREKGSVEWIERDYAWRVDLRDESIRIITLPATHLMPFHELPPLPMAPENL